MAPDVDQHSNASEPYIVYILRCRDDTLYTGITTDLCRRVQEHNNGTGSKYTRSRRPVAVAYQETQPDRSAALKREAFIKRLSRRKKLALISKFETGNEH
ncbi:MAG: GIY-YIG nuclease family protein [Oscillospiraceae bacterium]|nr:GIY-YIG nuclease family protein [Oscillospiraceae bacterium]